MADFFCVVVFFFSWWLGASIVAELLKRRGVGRAWQLVLGIVLGSLLSSVIGAMVSPPAHWLGYLLAVLALSVSWNARDRLRRGVPVFGDERKEMISGANNQSPVFPVVSAVLESDETPLLSRLRGLCLELVDDGTLDEDEIHTLNRWMLSHPEVLEDDLARLLADHLSVVLADGEISPLESIDLFDLAEALATGKTFDEMRDWKPLAISFDEEDKKPRRRAKREGKPVVKGAKLGTISFSYRNANGEYSDRRVAVQEVGGGYFKGRCLTRKAQRTFRIDRILGDVVSEDTGEVLDAYEWAETVAASQ